MADQFSSDDGLGPSQPGDAGTDTSKPTLAEFVVRAASAGRPDGRGALPPEPLSREGLEHLDGLRGELAEAVRGRARRGPRRYRLVAIGGEWATPAQASVEPARAGVVAR